MESEGVAVIVFFALVLAAGAVAIGVAALAGRRSPSPEEDAFAACGADSDPSPCRESLEPYFLTTVLFVVLSVGIAFLYPLALLFRRSADGTAGVFLFVEAAIFFGMMTLVLISVRGLLTPNGEADNDMVGGKR